MPNYFPPLSPEELRAIQAYAARHGRRWKSELRTAWFNASEPGHLQSIRNSHGPTWLTRFRLSQPDRRIVDSL